MEIGYIFAMVCPLLDEMGHSDTLGPPDPFAVLMFNDPR